MEIEDYVICTGGRNEGGGGFGIWEAEIEIGRGGEVKTGIELWGMEGLDYDWWRGREGGGGMRG